MPARPGAGRPAGAQCIKTKARVDHQAKALEGGVSPLEVMLKAMREYDALADDAVRHPAADDVERQVQMRARREFLKCATDIAKEAAPYCHSKLSQINTQANLTGNMQLTVVTGVPSGWE